MMIMVTIFMASVYSTIIFFGVLLAAFSFNFNFSLKRYLKRTFPFWMILTVFQLILISIFQFDFVKTYLLPYQNIFGIRYYTSYSSEYVEISKDWNFFLSFFFIVVFFFAICHILEMMGIERQYFIFLLKFFLIFKFFLFNILVKKSKKKI